MRRSLLAVSFALFSLCSACATTGSMQQASTIGKGNVQGGVASDIYAIVVYDNRLLQGQSTLKNFNPFFAPSGIIRVGVSDNVDLGARIGFNGAEIHGKFMFTDPSSSFVVSLAPTVQGWYLPSLSDGMGTTTANVGLLSIPVPVLLGLKLGRHELTFGVREVNLILFDKEPGASSTTIEYLTLLGASAGIALHFGETFTLMPELSFQTPIFASARTPYGTGSVAGSLGMMQVSFGIGCMFGRWRPRQFAEQEAPPPPEHPETPYVPPMSSPPVAPPPGNSNDLPPDVAPPPPPPPPPPAPGA